MIFADMHTKMLMIFFCKGLKKGDVSFFFTLKVKLVVSVSRAVSIFNRHLVYFEFNCVNKVEKS